MSLDTASILMPYQKRFVTTTETNRFIVVEKSRRIGFSYVIAYWSVYRRLTQKVDHIFVSANLETAKEFIRYCKFWCEAFNLALGYDYIDLKKATTESVELPNGSRIVAVSSNPTAMRGRGGDVTLDEFAFHDNQEQLLAAAQPVTTWNEGIMIICSTHNGPSTEFARICTEAKAGTNGYRHVRIDLNDAIAEGFALKVKGEHHKLLPDISAVNTAFYEFLKTTCPSEEAFKQEFLCQPLSMQSLITLEEYTKLALWDVPETLDPKQKYNSLHIGIDVGRVKDLTVVWVLEEYENPKATSEWDRYDYKTVCKLEIKNATIPAQWERIKPILQHQAVSTIAIDQGTVGRSLADLVADDFPFAALVNFTLPFKAKIAERVKGFVQYERVSLPMDDLTRADLLSLKRQAGKNGGVQYEGSSGDSHCDRFWALALALEAACSDAGAAVVH